MTENTGLLIDWITLRTRVDTLPPSLQERLFSSMNVVCAFKTDSEGNPTELEWESKRLNFDSLRSDSDGLYFTATYVGNTFWLYIGASPASLLNECNVFGSLDIVAGAEAVVLRARRAFSCMALPVSESWELTRLDVTGNYALPDFAMVKTALRSLLGTDSARRKATSAKNGGDTVQWAPTSDYISAKGYHKGPHLRYLASKAQIVLSDDLLGLADKLLRLEAKFGSRYWRYAKERRNHRFYRRHWATLTAQELTEIYFEVFGPLVDGVEVKDMGRIELIERIQAANSITAGRARAAFKTYSDIRDYGLYEVKSSMPERTFYLHRKYLKAAGFTDADLSKFLPGNVVQFRPVRIVLAQPVAFWDDLRRVA